jgi:hypothetical protein
MDYVIIGAIISPKGGQTNGFSWVGPLTFDVFSGEIRMRIQRLGENMCRHFVVGISDIPNVKFIRQLLKELPKTMQGRVLLSGPKYDVTSDDPRISGHIVVSQLEPDEVPEDSRIDPCVEFQSEVRTGMMRGMTAALGWVNARPERRIVALNVHTPWPDPKDLEPIGQTNMQPVILAVGDQSLKEAWNSAKEVAIRLERDYSRAVTRVVFYAHRANDPEYVALVSDLLRETRNRLPAMPLGIRLGILPRSLIPTVTELLRVVPGLSIHTSLKVLNKRKPACAAQFVTDMGSLILSVGS